MDWTSLIGRQRPRERDGLRLLVLVHQLGERESEVDAARAVLRGETRLQILDHLLRHPIDLALVAMAQFARQGDLERRRATIARRVRRLLPRDAAERRRFDQHQLLPVAWERRDDVLAYLACRDLLHVRALSGPTTADPGYVLTAAGAQLLETLYSADRAAALDLERCRLLADVLDPADLADLPALLEATAQHLASLRREDLLGVEDDFLTYCFQLTFEEAP